jgi:glycosyltransferase involved in cell wall biosynthesis
MLSPLDPHPLVSVILNNYNYARFLPEAIQSALNQTYSPVEVIAVDDGSRDGSNEVITKFRRQITAIFKENGGQASALNAGFACSQGDIVIFLDSDDVLHPDAAGLAVDVFRANPETAKVQFRMEVIDVQGRPTGAVKPDCRLPLLSGDLRQQALAFPFDLPWLPTSGNAFAADVLKRIFPIPESSFRILADYYLSHLAPLFGPVVSLEQVGAWYRVHGSNHYEPFDQEIDLDHVRKTILHCRKTQVYLRRYADELELDGVPASAKDIISVSYIANRLVSLKLDPDGHPLPGDTVRRLLRLGAAASLQRFDVPLSRRLVFLAWFMMTGFAPARWLVYRLAEQFFYPEKRVYLK